MKTLLRITPQHKKSIEMHYEVYAVEGNGPPRSFKVTEQYRSGQGFMEIEDCDPDVFGSESIICQTNFKQDPHFGDNHGNIFQFGDGFSEAEKGQIVQHWVYGDENYNFGIGWIEANANQWAIDDEYLEIYAPYKVDLVDGETFAVIQESLNNDDLVNLLAEGECK